MSLHKPRVYVGFMVDSFCLITMKKALAIASAFFNEIRLTAEEIGLAPGEILRVKSPAGDDGRISFH